MKRRVNVYLSDHADDILIAIFSNELRKKVRTSQSKVVQEALIYYYENKAHEDIEKDIKKD